MNKQVKSLIFFDSLLFPLYQIFLSIFSSSKFNRTDINKVVIIKFFGIGSIVRIAYFFSLFPEKKITLITLAKNKKLCEELEIDAIYIRHSLLAFFDLILALIKIWRMNSTEIVDFERSSNVAGIFRVIAGVGKKCTSFDFEPSSSFRNNQRVISFQNKTFYEAMEELFKVTLPQRRDENRGVCSSRVLVNVNAGDYMPERKYSIEQFVSVVQQFKNKKKDSQIVLTGAINEVDYTEQFSALLKQKGIEHESLVGKLNLTEFFKELKTCEMLITNDSGPLHLANYFNVPTVAIWGPTSAKLVGYPDSERMKNVSLEKGCSPCFFHPKSNVAQACNHKIDCLIELDPSKVVSAALSISNSLKLAANAE